MRSAARSDWCRTEITFVSRGRPSDATRKAYGNARVLTGQRYCSVLVAAADIAQTCIDRRSTSDAVNDPTIPPRTPSGLGDAWDFVTALRAIIRPYLSQGHPHLSLVAEIAGMSEQTLQRRLAESGSTYSQIVQEARFSIASDLLADPHLNITGIAFAAGYDNTPHFSGAFKGADGHEASGLPPWSVLKLRRGHETETIGPRFKCPYPCGLPRLPRRIPQFHFGAKWSDRGDKSLTD